jgi:hypothetical protein
MKNLLLLLSLVVATAAAGQAIPNSTRQAGEYFGVLLPSGAVCSTERLIISLTVATDGTLTGEIVNWENAPVFSFASEWPDFRRGTFRTTIVPTLESGVRGTFDAARGAVAGVVNMRPDGGCLYTFKAYRRFKLN